MAKTEVSEEDVGVLEELEKAGVLSPRIAGKVRLAVKIGDKAGRIRVYATLFFSLLIVGSVLCATAIKLDSAWPFLHALCTCLAIVSGIGAITALVHWSGQ